MSKSSDRRIFIGRGASPAKIGTLMSLPKPFETQCSLKRPEVVVAIWWVKIDD
jgi:hypothetical protein